METTRGLQDPGCSLAAGASGPGRFSLGAFSLPDSGNQQPCLSHMSGTEHSGVHSVLATALLAEPISQMGKWTLAPAQTAGRWLKSQPLIQGHVLGPRWISPTPTLTPAEQGGGRLYSQFWTPDKHAGFHGAYRADY